MKAAVTPACSFLLRRLLDRPQNEVGFRLLHAEPFQLGRDLSAVVGGVVHDVPQDRPGWERGRPSAPSQSRRRGEPLRGERGQQLVERR